MRGSIFGSVVRGDNGQPVAGAKISLVNEASGTKDRANVPVTDRSGWFAIHELPAGNWLVSVLGPRGGRGEAKVTVFDNATSEIIIELNGLHRWLASALKSSDPAERAAHDDLHESSAAHSCKDRLPSAADRKPVGTGSVRGRVVWADNDTPVADAAIGIVRGAGPAPDIAPLTGPDGCFDLDGLPAGIWLLGAVAPDGKSGNAEFQVYENEITNGIIKVGREPSRR